MLRYFYLLYSIQHSPFKGVSGKNVPFAKFFISMYRSIMVKISFAINYFLNMTSSTQLTHLPFEVLLDFLLTVKAVPHECVIRTGQS